MELLLTVVSLAIIASLSGLAVFHPAYNDTAIQRISISGLCLGALASIKWCFTVGDVPDPVVWCSVAGAIYSLETARKALKFHCR